MTDDRRTPPALAHRLRLAAPVLVALAALILFGGVATVLEATAHKHDGFQIAFTGRERAEANRVRGLVAELQAARGRDEQRARAAELGAAMSEWRAVHEELLGANRGGLARAVTRTDELARVEDTLDAQLIALEHQVAALIGAVGDAGEAPLPPARLRELTSALDLHYSYYMYTLDAIDLKLARQMRSSLLRVQLIEGVAIVACALLIGAIAWWLLRPAHRALAAQLAQVARSAAELREKRNLLAQFYVGAERQRAQRDEQMAAIAHDLKSPLAAISTAAALVRLRPDSAAAMSDKIHELCQRGAHMIDAVLGHARDDAGLTRLEPTPVDPRQLVAETVAPHRDEAARKGLALTVRSVGEVPDELITDAEKLARVIDNLVRNAIAYTDTGTVDISLSSDGLSGRGAGIRIDVVDTGQGIANGQLARLFQPYERANRGVEGHGLGLSIVQRLAAQLGAEVHAQSEEGRGSRFTVSLPLEPPAPGNRLALDLARSLRESDVLHGARMLIADDDPALVETTRELLEAIGADVSVAFDGRAAVQVVQHAARADRPLHVALIDIGMPLRDGYEVCAALRADSPATRLIAVTGYAFRHSRERCLEHGFHDYLTKPASAAELLEHVVRWLPTEREPGAPASDIAGAVEAARAQAQPAQSDDGPSQRTRA